MNWIIIEVPDFIMIWGKERTIINTAKGTKGSQQNQAVYKCIIAQTEAPVELAEDQH